jgi:quercetin dioxygenase-like cupin family protein
MKTVTNTMDLGAGQQFLKPGTAAEHKHRKHPSTIAVQVAEGECGYCGDPGEKKI